MNENEIVADILIALACFTFIYFIIGGFDNNRINQNGYSIVSIDNYKKEFPTFKIFFKNIIKIIWKSLIVVGSLILIGLIIWGIVAFPIVAIVILLILILLK